jgi:hypothetical protein
MANNKTRDPIPKHFKSVEEAAEFWDRHDLADYWDLTQEAHFEVDIQRSHLPLLTTFEVAVNGGQHRRSVLIQC